MRDETPAAATPDSSIPPFVPAEADGDVRAVLRTPWARRWSLIVMLLMFAWTALAWQLNTRHYRQRLADIVAQDPDTGAFNEPAGLSIANGKLYVADTNAHRIRVVDLATKAVTTLALKGVEPVGK